MCSTTTSQASKTDIVRRVYPPCRTEAVSKTVNIKIYDPKHEIQSNSALNTDALQKVEQFYNGLKLTPGLDSIVKSDIEQFTFNVNYIPAAPSQTEIKAFGRMDFPFYILTYGAANLTTVDEAISLIEAHQVSSHPTLRRTEHNNIQIYTTSDVYKQMYEDWNTETVLGFGIPGVILSKQIPVLANCRKLGFIKIDALLAIQSPYDSSEDRLAWVLKHELGHMLALEHKDNTIMNDKYDRHFPNFDLTQITYIRDTLKVLLA